MKIGTKNKRLHLHTNLINLREKHNLSRKQLADKLKVGLSSIANWESENSNVIQIERENLKIITEALTRELVTL